MVQGVFFRTSTKEMADTLGIKGWVKNESDGSVLILAEGPADQLNQFLSWVEKGPSHAQVSDTEKEVVDLVGYSNFKIKYF